jgi:prepilin-type N-terminal cleavage/methylation domain-containing protein
MRRGFTMLELLLAIMILSIMTIISTMVFDTIRMLLWCEPVGLI